MYRSESHISKSKLNLLIPSISLGFVSSLSLFFAVVDQVSLPYGTIKLRSLMIPLPLEVCYLGLSTVVLCGRGGVFLPDSFCVLLSVCFASMDFVPPTSNLIVRSNEDTGSSTQVNLDTTTLNVYLFPTHHSLSVRHP